MRNCVLVIVTTLLFLCSANRAAFAQGEGDQFVLNSLNRLLAVNTIDCEIRIETFVDKSEYTAFGRYKEQALPRTAPGQPVPFQRSMYRLELVFTPGPTASSTDPNRMTLVCRPAANGERGQIEQYISLEGHKSFRTIDLTKLEEQLRKTDKELFFRQVSEVRNLGGLAGKIRQISRFYEFSLPIQNNLQDGETIPALKLTGQLRSMFQKELLPQFGGLSKRGNYPANFPSDIELWLGRADDFPYKIRYLRRHSETSERKDLLFQESFFKVVLEGTPIPVSEFTLRPPEDVSSVDDTGNFLRSLGL